MKIGIFSKFAMSGGSEFRCAALASGIAKFTEHDAYLISDRGLPAKVKDTLHPDVTVIHHAFRSEESVKIFYEMDKLLIINTDSKFFTLVDFWEGKTPQNKIFVDLSKIKQMNFLFNFIVSPARHLCHINKICKDVRVLTTNKRFFNEITTKDKHKPIRHLPRMILRSPINPDTVSDCKIISDKIRIGKHSKGMGGKWNKEHLDVIMKVNQKVGEKVIWDFMGMPRDMINKVKDLPNVITRKEFSLPVGDFLSCIDIFFFFNAWDRQEPWARAMGEGMCAGCAVLANRDNAGNEEQILHGNNGYLFKNSQEAISHLIHLVNNPELIKVMGRNNLIYSREFCSENVIKQLLNFIR